MTNSTQSSSEPGTSPAPPTLATLLAALEDQSGLSETRRRDLRSAVKRGLPTCSATRRRPSHWPWAPSGTGSAPSIRSPSG
jgi:hypothetical protein